MSQEQATIRRPQRQYQRVRDQLEREVLSGRYPPGHRLPSLAELSASLGCNHLTLRRGMDELASKGLIDIRPRVGTFVSQRIAEMAPAAPRVVLGVRTYMRRAMGQHPAAAAYFAGLDRKQQHADFISQVMFYRKGCIAQDLGPRILRERINAFILADGGHEADYEFFKTHRIHVVDCGGGRPDHDWPCTVIRDRPAVIRQAMDHLVQLGHRRIAMVNWPGGPDAESCDQAFRRAYFDRRLGDARGLLLRIDDSGDNPQWEQIEALFDATPWPTAVIVGDECIADALVAVCERRGLRVPEDLSIAAITDATPFGHRLPITAPDSLSVNQRMIEQALDMLLDLAKGSPRHSRHEILTPQLIVKASTAPRLASRRTPE